MGGVSKEGRKLSLAEILVIVAAEGRKLGNSLQERFVVVKRICDGEQEVPLVL